MTILPKKKVTQGKNENESQESVQHHHGGGHIQNISSQDSLNREIRYPNRTSPPLWHPNNSRESPSSEFDGYYDTLESTTGPCHSSSKRLRHRASPHRNLSRKGHGHLSHRNSASPQASGLLANSVTSQSEGAAVSDQRQGEAAAPTSQIEDHSGYNSGDEYENHSAWTAEEWEEREKNFEKKMRKKSFSIKKMCEDGACLFRAVADQVYGDQEMHPLVRNHCMDYMLKNSDYYSQYVTEDFNQYVNRKRKDNIHGNHIEIQALSEMYNRPIEIYHYSSDPINTFHSMAGSENEPIRLSYHKRTHYNSIVNPCKATIGVGLGLPAFTPGLAEKNLMGDAKKISEQFQLEQAMLEDKLKATDWEATNEVIEEQVARESYLQWLKDNEKRTLKGNSSSTATSDAGPSAMESTTTTGATPGRTSPRTRTSPRNSPKADCSYASQNIRNSPVASVSGRDVSASNLPATHDPFPLIETATFMDQHPPSTFGLTEWDDANILAQVLAVSQQEYLDRLKQESNCNNSANKEGSGS